MHGMHVNPGLNRSVVSAEHHSLTRTVLEHAAIHSAVNVLRQALSISPTCPVDRSHLALDDLVLADPLIRNLVNELPVECPNKVAGCEETPQRQLLDLHLRDACKHTDTRGNDVSHPTTEDERLKMQKTYISLKSIIVLLLTVSVYELG
ncbi:hypothetical protein QCA50_004627 [Cerrena zonata]|uniref:Uncharacterized protein n=1 Tax=Cerrena zonata TaxID=2478898 RepID=A0AAW0GU85_9APHY